MKYKTNFESATPKQKGAIYNNLADNSFFPWSLGNKRESEFYRWDSEVCIPTDKLIPHILP